MSRYKQSFYNINLVQEGYVEKEKDIIPVYNTLRGKFGYIPDYIDYDNPPEQLLREYFIVSADVDEPERYRQNQIKAIENEYPQQVALTICSTMLCNYQCKYCFENNHKGVDMSDETCSDIIRYIQNEIDRNTNLKSLRIKWFGGEPLMRMDVIKRISEFIIPYCQDRDIQYAAEIVTNGYLLTKEISIELKGFSVNRAQIALDGFEDTYKSLRIAPDDAYQKVLYNIENSVIPVSIRLNTTRHNTDEIIGLAKQLCELSSIQEKRNSLTISRVKEYSKPLSTGFTDKEWLAFRQRRNEFRASVNNGFVHLDRSSLIPCVNLQKRSVVLCADGYIYRCENDAGYIKRAIGTIKDGIKTNDTEKKYICSTITGECKQCKYLPICCGGRCRYDELVFGKSCKLIQGRFRQNMQDYLKYVYNSSS